MMARTPIHPGEHLAEELDLLGLSPSEFAQKIDVPAIHMNEIIAGERAVSADTALRLGHWFGMDPAFWMNLQSLHDLRKASLETGEAIRKLPRMNDNDNAAGINAKADSARANP